MRNQLNILSPHTLIFHFIPCTGGAVDVTGVVAGAVAAFVFLLVLLVTSAVVAVVFRRSKQKKGITPVEGTGESEMVAISLTTTTTTSRQQENFEANCGREDLHYESADALGQSPPTTTIAVRSVGDYYDIIDAPSQEAAGAQCNDTREEGQLDDQAKDAPNVVYAVVDKSKKKREEKTQGGASATTTQGVCTEAQHYEWSSVLGQDWFGNEVEGKPEDNHGDVGQGSPSVDAKGTGRQCEPCNPNAVYAVVDKSKKRNRANGNDSPSQTSPHAQEDEAQKHNTG